MKTRLVIPVLFAFLSMISPLVVHAQPAGDGSLISAGHPQAGDAEAASTKPARDDLADIPPQALALLSSEQIVQILKQREMTRIALAKPNEPPAVAMAIPFALFATTVLIVSAILVFRFRKHAQLHQTMQKMIDKGIDIPPALMLPPAAQDRDLRRGMVFTGGGIALGIALFVLGAAGMWAIGLIPLFIGIGYLAVWRITSVKGA